MRLSTFQSIALRVAITRILADIVFLGTALFFAFSAYMVGWVMLWRNYPDQARIREALATLYVQNVFTLALVGVLVFALSGFYTHARGYRGRFRLLVIFNAVSLTFLLHSFLASFTLRFPVPRGVTFLAWLFSVGLIGGSRMLKGYVNRTYQIRRRVSRADRPVQSVLVIGGAGYIGSVLVRRLLEKGFQVRVLDALLFGDSSIAALRGHPRFELLQADFRHVDSVVKAVQSMDAVIHLGAIVGDPACKLDSKTSLETNLAATAMIKSVCCGAGIRRFLFASTCSVYGASDHLLDERSGPNPISLYACTKLDSERVILGSRTPDFAPAVLRLGTAFGWSERPRFDLLVNLLAAQALVEGRITIFNQTQWRPFIHVEDIARAFVACLQAPLNVVAYETFNVGSGQMNATLGELASVVKTQIPRVKVEYVDVPADRRDYRVRFDKISDVLGFTCLYTIEHGIEEIKKAIESGKAADYRDARYHNDRTLELISARALSPERDDLVSASERFLRGSAPAAAIS